MKKVRKRIAVIVFMILMLQIVFTVSAAETTHETDITIKGKQQAIYECKVNFSKGTKINIEMTGDEDTCDLFEINDSGMKIGGVSCTGTFEAGKYRVKAYISPLQKSVKIEITQPNGGIIRRGSHAFLEDNTTITQITSEASKAKVVTDETVTYSDINLTEYTFEEEPQYTGFDENVYNLVTSFDDAKTTRNFAWTAKADYIGADGVMAVKYKKTGDAEWTVVGAEREVKHTDIDVLKEFQQDIETLKDMEFFKADITNLVPGTSYEYKIGKKDSTDEANDWSKTYTFVTEKENVNEFSFIAIGDSQAQDWAGDFKNGFGTKGFKYAQEAIKQAIADTGNPAFMLHAGDIVETARNSEQWDYYFKALGDVGKTLPHFAAVGNHDAYAALYEKSPFYFDLHFNHPNNGGAAAFAEGVVESVAGDTTAHDIAAALVNNLDETVYSFDYGNAHIIVLNSGIFEGGEELDKPVFEAQRAWLEADLKANEDAVWTIMMEHQAVYNVFDGAEDRAWLSDLIEEYGVDLVIQGHTHLTSRTYPMKDGKVVTNTADSLIKKGSGTVYTTIGATTLAHDKLLDGIEEKFVSVYTPDSLQPTYTTVTVNDDELKFTIKQINGFVVDQFTITSNDVKTEAGVEPWVIAVLGLGVVALVVTGLVIWKKRK